MPEQWEDLRIQAHEKYLVYEEEMLRRWKSNLWEAKESVDRAETSIRSYEERIRMTKSELAEQYKLRGY